MGQHKSQKEIPIIGADVELQSRQPSNADSINNAFKRNVHRCLADYVNNERNHTRYPIFHSVVCFPILASHEVDVSFPLVGVAVDIGMSGVKVQVDATEPFEGLEILLGIEQQNGERQFCSGVVTSSRSVGRAGVEAGIQFGGYMHEVLDSDPIFPVLDRSEMKFVLPYPESVLASLCKVGAAHAMLLDAVTLCPNCHGIPTFRSGCSLCLSSNVQASKMIHHFACAHVDFVENFEQGNELCCQKCRTRRLIVGSDFEYLDGPNHCHDCGQANLEKIQIGHCLNCEYRFPIEAAYSMEIVGYRVNKLDLLGFINTA
jgi:hypothetical protein